MSSESCGLLSSNTLSIASTSFLSVLSIVSDPFLSPSFLASPSSHTPFPPDLFALEDRFFLLPPRVRVSSDTFAGLMAKVDYENSEGMGS